MQASDQHRQRYRYLRLLHRATQDEFYSLCPPSNLPLKKYLEDEDEDFIERVKKRQKRYIPATVPECKLVNYKTSPSFTPPSQPSELPVPSYWHCRYTDRSFPTTDEYYLRYIPSLIADKSDEEINEYGKQVDARWSFYEPGLDPNSDIINHETLKRLREKYSKEDWNVEDIDKLRILPMKPSVLDDIDLARDLPMFPQCTLHESVRKTGVKPDRDTRWRGPAEIVPGTFDDPVPFSDKDIMEDLCSECAEFACERHSGPYTANDLPTPGPDSDTTMPCSSQCYRNSTEDELQPLPKVMQKAIYRLHKQNPTLSSCILSRLQPSIDNCRLIHKFLRSQDLAPRDVIRSRGGLRSNVSLKQGRSHSVAKVRVGVSPIQGYGLFANHIINHGQFIIEYCGEIISSHESDIRELIYQLVGRNYLFTLNDDFLIDGCWAGNESRYINGASHGMENCQALVEKEDGVERINIYATKNIDVGEELLLYYGQFSDMAKQNIISTDKSRDPRVVDKGEKKSNLKKSKSREIVWHENDQSSDDEYVG